MKFELNQSIEILERTPLVLESLLNGLSKEWVLNNEGKDTWSPYDVLGHLIFGEKTDWIVRTKIILSDADDKTFEPFDRFAQLNEVQNKPINELIEEFKLLRTDNLKALKDLISNEKDLDKIGIHPELGKVTLKQLISAWAVHDLGHIGQISRVMAKQYSEEVGSWIEYLSVLKR